MDMNNIDKEIITIFQDATRDAKEFEQLMALFRAGVQPDREKARQVATELARQGKRFKAVLDELETSKDFQAQEAYHTMFVQTDRARTPNMRIVEKFLNWQAEGLMAFADNRPLPPLPPGVDPTAMAATGLRTDLDIFVTVGRELPFNEGSFEFVPDGESLKASFLQLVKEHTDLIGLGGTYGDFDPAGKEFYLGQMAQITFKWEDLMDRALEAGVSVTPAYKFMSENYLGKAGLSPDDFRDVMDDLHSKMRQVVNKEKGIGA